MNKNILDIEKEIEVSISSGLYDGVDICQDIMTRLSDTYDFSVDGSLFYYTPLAVQDVINKSYEK